MLLDNVIFSEDLHFCYYCFLYFKVELNLITHFVRVAILVCVQIQTHIHNNMICNNTNFTSKYNIFVTFVWLYKFVLTFF